MSFPMSSPSKAPRRPRVPVPVEVDIAGVQRTLQVNHCRSPHCENYGLPARTDAVRPGPSSDRDPGYKVHSTSRGTVPSIRCKACQDNPPMKSNAGIAAEVRRMVESGGALTVEEVLACKNADCAAHGRPIASFRKAYRKKGRTSYGAQRWQCCLCGGTLVANPRSTRLRDGNRRLAADVFSRIANKAPVRGTARGAKLKSNTGYYTILDFIHARCRSHNGAIDRGLMDGRLRLPDEMNVQSDAQSYTLNWISRLDRRNAELSCYATVDARSGFILGMHSNFDGRVDPFKVNSEAARAGEMELPEPHRPNTSQYWLAETSFVPDVRWRSCASTTSANCWRRSSPSTPAPSHARTSKTSNCTTWTRRTRRRSSASGFRSTCPTRPTLTGC